MFVPALTFACVAAVLTVTPGVDSVLVLRTAAVTDRRNGVAVGLGVCTGVLFWGLATALGVAALLTASRIAYDTLRILGAAYLAYLGVRALRRLRRTPPPPGADAAPGPAGRAGQAGPGASVRRPTVLRSYTTGLATNLLNPKVGAFYLTLLPQFVPSGAPVAPTILLYAAIHAAEGALWLGLIATLVDRIRPVLARPAVQRRLEALTGLLLLAFGIRLATEPL